MQYSCLFPTVLAALSFAPTVLINAAAVGNVAAPVLAPRATDQTLVPFPFDEADSNYLEDAFSTIISIPDSVLDNGQEAVKDWVLAHQSTSPYQTTPQPQERSVNLIERQGWLQVAKCAWAITQAIIENALPISKLRRVRELIEAIGGVKKTAKLLLKAKGLRDLYAIGGPELAQLGEIFLGVTGIIGPCFSWI
ncbi:MAG: hypothetical protein Q9218_007469 [Villophora microphyllina]